MAILDKNGDLISYLKWIDCEDDLPFPGKPVFIYIPFRDVKLNEKEIKIAIAYRKIMDESEIDKKYNDNYYKWVGEGCTYETEEVTAWTYIDDTNIPKTSR